MMKRFILCVVLLLASVGSACPSMPYGDLNCDGRVDIHDLAILVSHWLREFDTSYPNKVQVSGITSPEGANGFYEYTESFPYNIYTKGDLLSPPSVYEYMFAPQSSGDGSFRWRLLDSSGAEPVVLFTSQYFEGGASELPPPNDESIVWTPEEAIGTLTVTAVPGGFILTQDMMEALGLGDEE